MRQHADSIAIRTRGKGLYEFTHQAIETVRASGIDDGLLTLYLQHTSASLLIQENADPEVQRLSVTTPTGSFSIAEWARAAITGRRAAGRRELQDQRPFGETIRYSVRRRHPVVARIRTK